MKAGHRRRYWLVTTVLTVLALTLVGHVCALPLHHHSRADDHHDSEDSVHAASCEVVVGTSFLVTGCPVVGVVGQIDNVGDTRARIVTIPSRPCSVHAPPLFLLHASLLI
jgi:hypothetical protein